MVEQQDLKKLEKSLYSKFQEDGIWDIFLGLFFIVLGLSKELYLQSDVDDMMLGIIIGSSAPLYILLKRKITKPRIGYVRFSKNNLKKHRSSYIYLALITVAIIIIGTMVYLKNFPSDYSIMFFQEYKILFFIMFSLLLTAVSFLFNIKRFLWYAVIIMLLFFLSSIMQFNQSYLLTFTGIIIIANGLKHIIEFIKKYPKQDSAIESNGV